VPRFVIQFIGVVLLTMPASQGWSQKAVHQHTESAQAPATVNSVRVVHEGGIPVVQVISSHPVVPAIQLVDSPPRLVIDLSNTRLGLQHKRIPVLQEDILTIRTEQYRQDPPVVRIVVDLLVPYTYTWDVTDNLLAVRLKPSISPHEEPKAANKNPLNQPPQVLSSAPAGTPAYVPVTSGVGEVVIADKIFAAGSSLTAGSDTAVLHLSRGGEIRVCPGTTISVTPSKSTKDLMLGISSGALETQYTLGSSADTVLTPDFRILFAGPGEFHFAVSTDSHGNTCVRGLAGNTSSAIVSELIGDRIYQVKPAEQAMFHSGRIDKVDADVPMQCGCPAPVSVLRSDASTRVVPESELPANIQLSQKDGHPSGGSSGNVLSNGPETRPLPPSQPEDVHIQVEAPFVFSGKASSISSTPFQEAARLPVTESTVQPLRLETQVLAPPSASEGELSNASAPRRFMRRVRSFFSTIFH
jgi:AMIN domain